MTAAYVAALVFGAGTLAVQLGLSAVGGGDSGADAHPPGEPADAPASH
ncbi:MAG: hypothetical protein FJ104_15535, partial [Deltaproteobacteria bacterium]|nr:hypothetical protein [Deltaproteobacteria bacterium]